LYGRDTDGDWVEIGGAAKRYIFITQHLRAVKAYDTAEILPAATGLRSPSGKLQESITFGEALADE
jgi:hypothetical protein